ncbi:MAG: efflux RND transporter periplasmic adaptor subunit [Xanthomonadales bacterium]|nr:efflux RND transporter periplasmic adaptor subunit [Xanthomonadales bacterium]
MRKWVHKLLPVLLIVGAIVVVVIMAQFAGSKKPEQRDDGPKAMLVEVITVEPGQRQFVIQSQGTVRPRTETTLVSEVSGKVVSVAPGFVAGGFFRKGETLLQIDPSDYQTAVKRAEANLASMQARQIDEQARSEQALRDWRNLGREGQPSNLVLRKPQLQDAEANVRAAEADLQKARRDLERTRISLPYDGLIREKRVDLGQYVTPGTPLGVSLAIDVAELRLPLSKNDLAFLDLPEVASADSPDTPAVTLTSSEANQSSRWRGRIVRTEGVVDEASRVIYAVARVADPYGLLGTSDQPELRFGTFVRAEIEGRDAGQVFVLPRSALQRDNKVLVADRDDRLQIRSVEVVRAESSQAWIRSGLEDGDRVVMTTIDAPVPGAQLTIAGAPEAATEAEASLVDAQP